MTSRRYWGAMVLAMLSGWLVATCAAVAQEEAKAPAPAEAAAKAPDASAAATSGEAEAESSGGVTFWQVVIGSGWLGIIIWIGLFGSSFVGFYLIIDSFVKIQPKKIMPMGLVDKVREAMGASDLVKAIDQCKEQPGPMANILMAGFSNVEEGFDVIQQVVNAVADLESEKLLQKVTYLSIVPNLSTMLGLMGTVQGMIYAFAALATQQAGAAQQAMLALNIAQALYTTMAGLLVAVPAVAFYYYFRNQANQIILNMVITTIDLIKALRNVEVVSE